MKESVEFGYEATAGTPVTPTTVWRGIGSGKDAREVVHVDENIGKITPMLRTYVPKLYAEVTLEETVATFEQIAHLFQMGIDNVSSSQDGAGDGYIWEWLFPDTTENAIKSYTIRHGDDKAAKIIEYCAAGAITLKGASMESWMMGGEIFGRQSSTGSLASPSVPTVEEILFGNTKFYLDNSTDAFGDTQLTGTALGAEIEIATGIKPLFTADGQLYFNHLVYGPPVINGKLKFSHNATIQAELAYHATQTQRLLRMIATGSAFSTTGTEYGEKTLIIDFPIIYSAVGNLEDNDGSNEITVDFLAGIDDEGNVPKITLVNDLSALPS